MDSVELTELLVWDRIKRGVKGPQDNAKAKAAMKAAFAGGRKGKGTRPAKPRKEPKR